MSARTTAHAGSFYPAQASEIERFFKAFEEMGNVDVPETPRALIVPHAGYMYSGFTAHLAFEQLRHSSAKRAIVIGPSHRVAFHGMSVSLFDEFATPLGALTIDKAYAERLKETYRLAFEPAMHMEHSTEVQMPFIKHYAPQLEVVEMVYGAFDPKTLGAIITDLLKDEENIVVISTDLSHFYTEEEANRLDNICLNAIDKREPSMMHSGCEACGAIGVEGVLIAAQNDDLNVKLLDYRTSSWATKDTSNVVGYTSAVFY
ncbi:AmmeMemoRadiSam system protein B [Sulfurimonas diazotrophicus]|uniref:MEMO1 family protein WCY31_01750 n=1 Tax=Sulfurimonas diazotrophicus TaxID=3131939 RepID=A0ABZ3HA82_9BACT